MADKLTEYTRKRDFQKTSEPAGEAKSSAADLRFVIQHHLARADHYDFRLEWNGVLLSWAVPKGPSLATTDKRLAVKVEDHPLEYRNFEGTIPAGEYGGGTVMLWDEGFWQPLVDVEEGLEKGELKFYLNGKRLKGHFALIKWKSAQHKEQNHWLLLKEKDEYVEANYNITEFNTSIRSGRTMEGIVAGKTKEVTQNPFKKAAPQLAKLVDSLPKEHDWVYEVKYDGYRILAFIENHQVRLMTRNNIDYLDKFTELGTALAEFAGSRAMVLDGEVVMLDKKGKSSFQALQSYLNQHKKLPITYIVFDLLSLDGKDLRDEPLATRKKLLATLMEHAPAELMLSSYIENDANDIFQAACEAGLEGLVGKQRGSSYNGKRDGSWIKIKCMKRQEFVIGGYTLTDKRSDGISALLLGVYENDSFVYVGRAGTGMNMEDMQLILKKLKSSIRVTPAFTNAPKERSNEKITWVKPDLVAEIQFAEWTEDDVLRHPSFKGLRTDKDAKAVSRERADKELPTALENPTNFENPKKANNTDIVIAEIKITHPDKVLYQSPVVTKLDVVKYYEKVAARMLPYVEKRILSVVRCPRGIKEACFFMKHPVGTSEQIVRIAIDENDGEEDQYFYLEQATGLIYEAQMGTIEFHTWGSSIKSLEKPDVMVFDLDPDEGMDLSRVRQGVRDLKGILDELSLTSYLKTSGGKGYHIVMPLKPKVPWDKFHDFARNIAEVMEQKWPDRYTSNVRKEKRKNKIFIDWIRNGRGATSVAPYSVRARAGAKVSMPIAWEELDLIGPAGIDMQEALQRVDGEDPWQDFFQQEQTLS